MQLRLAVFDHADAISQQFRIERLRDRILDRELAHSDQQRDGNAALRRMCERLAKLAARREIRRGKQHAVARMAQRLQVGALDRGAVAQVVAHDERRARGAGARWRGLLAHFAEQFQALAQPQAAGAGPLALRLVVDLRNDRPAQPRREIPARRRQAMAVGVVAQPVVVNVDAADKGDLAVDHGDLAVRTRNAALAQRVEDAVLGAGLGQHQAEPRCNAVTGAEPVHQHPHLHAAPGGARERIAHGVARFVFGKNIGFEQDFMAGSVERGDQRREERDAALQQRDVIVVDEGNAAHGLRPARVPPRSVRGRTAWPTTDRASLAPN